MYASTAQDEGKVIGLDENGIVVEYKNGKTVSHPIGRVYGENAGMTIPHELTSPLKVGDKFVKGDILTYNTGFFEPDYLDPKKVVWMNGTYAKVVLVEDPGTLEDASEISPGLAEKLKTQITHTRTVVLEFEQGIVNLPKVGTYLKADDILCVIQDSITANTDVFTQEDLEKLQALGSQTPKAKHEGVLERIEVYYHGDKEDMSESLRKISNESDREFAKRFRSLNKKVLTGQVDEGFRIKGDPLTVDTLAIRFYITGPEPASVGDKIVFVNQLKSIIGRVHPHPMITKSGEEVDAKFSYTSVANRIVNSPEIIGTTTTLLKKFSKLITKAYDR